MLLVERRRAMELQRLLGYSAEHGPAEAEQGATTEDSAGPPDFKVDSAVASDDDLMHEDVQLMDMEIY